MVRIAIIPEPKKILAGEEGNADPVIREKKTDPDMGEEEYCLQLKKDGIWIAGGSEKACLHAKSTLEQIRLQCGDTLPCLTVLPLGYYRLDNPKQSACFGPIVVPVEDISGVKLPKEPWRYTKGSGPLPEGRLEDAELPEALLAAGKRYPTAEGYALVSAAKIGYPTDRELETWLANPGLYRPQLRGALVILRDRGDFRLKDTALRCAAVGDAHCSLKAEAFQVLAELKGDPDVEAFFIDYFVRLEEPPGIHGSAQNDLTQIAHSFWD